MLVGGCVQNAERIAVCVRKPRRAPVKNERSAESECKPQSKAPGGNSSKGHHRAAEFGLDDFVQFSVHCFQI